MDSLCRIVLVASLLAASTATAQEDSEAAPSFRRDVAPILVAQCLTCHGADEPEGEYQLHTFAALSTPGASGEAPIAGGEPELSELLRRIESDDEFERMPAEADPLPTESIAVVRRWIAAGAPFDGEDEAAELVSLAPRFPHPPAPAEYPSPAPVSAVAFTPSGDALAVGGYHEITLWSTSGGALVGRIGDVDRQVFDLAYSPDGSLLAAATGTPGRSGEVALYDAASGELLRVLYASADVALGVAFRPDGATLAACGADRAIRLLDPATGDERLRIEDHADWVYSVAFGPDGARLVSASRDKTCKVLDATSGESLATFSGHGDVVYDAAFLADGEHVASLGRDARLRLWQVEESKQTAELGGFPGEAFQIVRTGPIAFAVGRGGAVRQFQLDEKSQTRSLEGHDDWVLSAALDADGARLATGDFAGEVRLWDVASGDLLLHFTAAPGLSSDASNR